MPKQRFEIRVDGLLSNTWSAWFEGLTIIHLDCGQTLLTGLLDQAMLRGILMKISDLGFNLISVQLVEQNK